MLQYQLFADVTSDPRSCTLLDVLKMDGVMLIARPFSYLTVAHKIDSWNTGWGCLEYGVVLLEASSQTAQGLIAGWQDALREMAFPNRPALVNWGDSVASAVQAIPADASEGAVAREAPRDRSSGLAFGISLLPQTTPGSQAWLRWLAARASALYERLDGAWASNSFQPDDRIIERRLDRWATFVAPIDRREDFLRFLCWEGLNDADARRAVSSVRFGR